MRASLRSLDPRVSREVWVLLCGSFANAFGNGVVFPFFLIYLHNVRSIPLGTAGLDGPRHGYRRLLADHTFFGVVLLNAAVMGIGFALLGDIFPAYAKNEAGVSETAIGFIFLANTLVIVIAQLPVARLLFGVAFAVFAVGECFHGTVENALTADLAKPGLLGRYMALDSAGIVVGTAGGRAAGGFMLASAPNLLWIAAAFVALARGAYALVLERFLPADIRRTPYTVPPPSQTVAEVL